MLRAQSQELAETCDSPDIPDATTKPIRMVVTQLDATIFLVTIFSGRFIGCEGVFG
jgi:hypothetical protein